VGEDGMSVAEYFTDAEMPAGYEKPELLPGKANVAAWMFDCIGAITAAGKKIPAHEKVYQAS
jgi:hypothetical protein